MRPAVLDSALADASADAFVFVGPAGDPLVRALSDAALPCRAAVVYAGRVAVVPERPLPDYVSVHDDATVLDPAATPAERLPGLVGDSVLAPRTLPHDAALYLDNAGVNVSSTDAHLRARERKTGGELAALRDAQAAAEDGMAAAAALLANAAGDPLADDAGDVTAERVRRIANAAMAQAGANPETVVAADGPIAASDPVPIRVTPQIDGYHGWLARTFVADSDGGWERRATLAGEYAVDAGIDIVDVGETTVDAAADEVTAELGSYGFQPTAGTGTVHGVGLERRELPAGDDVIEPGAVLTVRAELDGEKTVWVADLGVATDDGVERVGDFPRSVVPKPDY
ncbi:M24 family metallopeptidase [Halobacterium noricense]|uniref:M24 family metallopeptidase n=1 Tax=Halobacterium noricense TaxID=223182 RepID=UPI001E5FFB5F|nr:M24 family metallopeptidase [Halobacterium noricense]UHH25497.1 M24 family metallopeptidase [Halobacterium noricense]